MAITEDGLYQVLIEATINPVIERDTAKYVTKMDALTKQLRDKKITIDAFKIQAHALISKSFTKAFRDNKSGDLTNADKRYLKDAINVEFQFASNFANDIVNNNLKMPRARRVNMYAKSIHAAAWNAKVESQNDNVLIYWKLGVAEHCESCIVLASQSPYRKWTLPTVPRAGDTECRSNCKCKLYFKHGKLTKDEKTVGVDYSDVREKPLQAVVNPSIPPGFKTPTEAQKNTIANLRTEMNFWRWKIPRADVKTADRAAAIVKRKELNAEINDFLKRNKLWDAPIISVDEIVTDADFGLQAYRELLSYGVSTGVVDSVAIDEILSLINEFGENL